MHTTNYSCKKSSLTTYLFDSVRLLQTERQTTTMLDHYLSTIG